MDAAQGYSLALQVERARNGRQISAFRLWALAAVLGLQVLFLVLLSDWTGAPMGPLAGYAAVAAVAWRLRHRFDAWAAYSGFTIAFLDMPMTFWLVRSSAKATVLAGTPELADSVLMMLPLIYAGFIVMASLALDTRQTLVAAAVAIVLQFEALSGIGHDLTFLSIVTAFTALIALIGVYWREQSVRLVRETSVEQLRRERLGRYFSPQVASLVEAGAMESGAGRREVTVLFADLRDFTKRAEILDPRQVVVLLNRFHTAMVAVVFANGGTLDKYLGDGLMAYFGAPVAQNDQAARAVRCAVGMQRALDALNRQGGVPGDGALRMGIGVHTGAAVVGDIGADTRREFTVIGDAVNVAARLEQLTKEYNAPVLVSASTMTAAGGEGFRLVDKVTLRGRSEAVEVYAPEAGA
jgi:adenylate cyclase